MHSSLSPSITSQGRADSISITEPLQEEEMALDFSVIFHPANGKVPPNPKKFNDSQIQSSTKYYFHNVTCPVTTNRELRTPLDGGSTKHIEVDITGSGVQVRYETHGNRID